MEGSDSPRVVLSAFGLAARLGADESPLTACCGTTGYMAPEVLARSEGKEDILSLLPRHDALVLAAIEEYAATDGYDEKADVWSAGIMLFECLAGKLHCINIKLID